MNYKLSIIIPCFNCAKTLEDAVGSVYTQNLTTPFEIIMVDDKSTDETVSLMQKLAAVYPEIKLYYHTYNKGGGATRNTGIRNSEGDLIFCLDSDNLLYPDTMQKMINHLIAQDCDGSVIYERRYFKERDINDYQSHFNHHINKPIKFENLFNNTDVLMDNFLFKKASYDKTSGYPEKHGFDTQCFEIRFLAAGNIAYVCPGTIFLHRQSLSSKGYFHRVYEKGLFSVNFYLIFEEIFYLFSQELIQDIVKYDIFSKNKLGENNLKSFILNRYKKIGKKIFIDKYEKYLTKDGAKNYKIHLSNPKNFAEKFVKAILLFHEKKYQDSYNLYLSIFKKYPDSKVIQYNLARCEIAIEGKVDESSIENEAIKKSGNKPVARKMVLDPSQFRLLLIRIKEYLIPQN